MGGAVVASRIPAHAQELTGKLPESLVENEAFILAVHDAFYVAAAICVVGILTSLVRDREAISGKGEG